MTTWASEAVRYELVAEVAVATLDAPGNRNALSAAVTEGLGMALVRAVKDEGRALVIAATGPAFCSGGDLRAIRRALEGDVDREIGAMLDRWHDLVRDLRYLPMPSVSALSGAAVGAGMALAMATDVRVAGSTASFSTGYLALGATPDGGASYHLARALGPAPALSSFLLNREFSAADLLAKGLVDVLVDDADPTAAAIEVAAQLGHLSTEAVLSMRELAYAASVSTFGAHLDAEKQAFLRVAHTSNFRADMARFKSDS
jgi:2-(1,2-epoxy-1,2-dihydrophenyl)acetyl-CoA isomerase